MPTDQKLLPAPKALILIPGRTAEELEAEFLLEQEFANIDELESFQEIMEAYDRYAA